MGEIYPDVIPDITVIRKRGLTLSQAQTVQEKVKERAIKFIGSEMVFDLAEYAKVLEVAR